MNETERKAYELWTDEKGQLWMYMNIGICQICKTAIFEAVPQNVLVKIDPALFCEPCRKGVLKLVRLDLVNRISGELYEEANKK